jgi:hypothetical protein
LYFRNDVSICINSKDMTARTGQLRNDCLTGLLGTDSENSTAKRRQLAQIRRRRQSEKDSQGRTSRTGKHGQDSQNWTDRTALVEQDCETGRIGQAKQDCHDVKAGLPG